MSDTSTGDGTAGVAVTPRSGGATASPKIVGARVRVERERQHIGVRELARRVDLSASLISQIELGKATPSVGTLYRIVNELGMSLDGLFFDSAPRGAHLSGPRATGATGDESLDILAQTLPSDPVVRRGARKAIQLGAGVQWERLTSGSRQDVDFLHVSYEPGGASCPEDSLMRHNGREFGLVLAGRLSVTIGFDTYELDEGDSITFESTLPHRLHNPGDETVEAVWFVLGRHGDPRTASTEQ